jgi:hypothetical protein
MVTFFNDFLVKYVSKSLNTGVFPSFIIMSQEKCDADEITGRIIEFLKPYNMDVYDTNDLASILLPNNKHNKDLRHVKKVLLINDYSIVNKDYLDTAFLSSDKYNLLSIVSGTIEDSFSAKLKVHTDYLILNGEITIEKREHVFEEFGLLSFITFNEFSAQLNDKSCIVFCMSFQLRKFDYMQLMN